MLMYIKDKHIKKEFIKYYLLFNKKLRQIILPSLGSDRTLFCVCL